jgi:hypothetical protein
MLGPPKPRRLDQPIAVSLDDIVPTSCANRHLEATIDLSFFRERTRGPYAERGRERASRTTLRSATTRNCSIR